ncbi:Prophage PSPPH05, DNA-binding protein [Pseudomonas amygdali pv. dendropanacis]|uniref:Prophage PSPPH05, DNA-binding protein n=1 Tax=Pseudomonas amygdali pv. dendropanacis TaxID=235272 RepID=A0A0P9RIJ2_PSEA0|nr:helix-turn-helix transcriptional regulator [Pseudomonas amygdali]KPX11630.1 Prophage PSPPH05, DNA-binding protein [Pseudomonas amygdali pv. dendropanacis]
MTTTTEQGLTDMSVAENIKKARENKGLKIEEAASICGIPLGTYRKYEAGSSLPTADPIRAMAKGFGVSTDEILMKPDERSVKAELRKLFSVVATLPECQQAEVKRAIKGLVMVFQQEDLSQ